ncbi:MAG: S-methyl-5-thioribose kinase [Peptostreptococcaceae bacterium]
MEALKVYDFTKEYFKMDEESVKQYSIDILNFFKEDTNLECKEIGDGNLNYVYRVFDNSTNKSVIIKQAGPVARISDDMKLSPDRNRIESEILKLQYELSPGLVPKIFNYDSIMNCCAMEDLSDHKILRTGLIEHEIYPKFADQITTFMVDTLLSTSDVVMNHKEKKDLLKNFVNKELCEISEDLVYTEPFFDCERNTVSDETKEFVEEFLWNDEEFKLETAKLKFDFMTNSQSLLHGDLHSGSIFVTKESTKVIDPEFAFYGPAGYDIGNVVAHSIFSYVNALYTMEDGPKKEEFISWIKEVIVDVIDMFVKKFNDKYDEIATETVAKYNGFKEYYLNSILKDTAGVCGMEMCRRIIGLANVKDIKMIDEESIHYAEKLCLKIAKELVMNRSNILSGQDYIDIILKY